jgi:hypothetical protein
VRAFLILEATMPTIMIERFAYAPDGTFGRITLPTGKQFFTVERAWAGNKPFESCIPDGVYDLKRRRSAVVERTSGGDYLEGWEVTDVPGRTFIMIHPGNWPTNFEGCIGVGLNYQVLDGRNGVTQSRVAFAQLMSDLDGRQDWQLDIRPFLMEYP